MVKTKVSTENSLVPYITKKGTGDKGTKVIFKMNKVSINKNMHLSEHYTLGEVTKTSVKTADGNIPSHVAIENLKNLCENWLEDLRYSYNTLYHSCHLEPPSCHLERSREISPFPVIPSVVEESHEISPCASLSRDDKEGGRDDKEGGGRDDKGEEPIIITSGYRSPEVNRAVGGAPTSNHLTGCAVDIRCAGIEQAIRYACILLDISDGTKRDYDELFIERSKQGRYWVHFAVRPKENRRKTAFIQT